MERCSLSLSLPASRSFCNVFADKSTTDKTSPSCERVLSHYFFLSSFCKRAWKLSFRVSCCVSHLYRLRFQYYTHVVCLSFLATYSLLALISTRPERFTHFPKTAVMYIYETTSFLYTMAPFFFLRIDLRLSSFLPRKVRNFSVCWKDYVLHAVVVHQYCVTSNRVT